MLTLRKFLFLDHVAVDDYLAQLGGSVSEEESITEDAGSSGSASLGVGPLRGSLGKEGSRSISRTGRMPAGARFAKLYDALTLGEDFTYLAQSDPSSWRELRRGQIIECDVEVARGKLHQLVTIASSVEPLVGLLSDDDAAVEAIRGLSGLGKMASSRGLPVSMALVDAPKYQFVGYLDESFLLTDAAGLHGTATVFCKIQRLLKPGESIDLSGLSEMASMDLPNRSARRQAKKGATSDADQFEAPIGFPAAEVTVVAIYR